jgi:hypothetical protein
MNPQSDKGESMFAHRAQSAKFKLFLLIGGIYIAVVYFWEIALFGLPSASLVFSLLVTVVVFLSIYTPLFWVGFICIWVLLRKLGWASAVVELLAAYVFIEWLGSVMRTTDWSVIYPIMFFSWVEWQVAKSIITAQPPLPVPERIEVSLAKIHALAAAAKQQMTEYEQELERQTSQEVERMTAVSADTQNDEEMRTALEQIAAEQDAFIRNLITPLSDEHKE